MISRIAGAVSLGLLAASFSAEAGIALAVGSKASLEGAPIVASVAYEQQAAGVMLAHSDRLAGTGTRIFLLPFSDFSAEVPVDAYGYLKTVPYRPDWLEWVDGTIINHLGVSGTSVSKLCVNGELFSDDPLVKKGLDGQTATSTVVPYASSAKDAVRIFGERMKSIGAKAPMSVIFADDEEVWIAEAYSGHEWAASKLPDDGAAVVLGLPILGALSDKKETAGADESSSESPSSDAVAMMSENIPVIAEKAWTAAKKKGPPVLSKIFACGYDGASQVFSWTARDRFAPVATGEFERNADYSGFIYAEMPIDMKNVFSFVRTRIETELPRLPARDRKSKTDDAKQKDSAEKILISGDNASKAVVFQHRKGKQDFLWLSLTNPEYSPFVPFYANIKTIPDSYAMGSSSYASGISYWVFKFISEALERKDNVTSLSVIKKTWMNTEQEFLDEIDSMDIQYLDSDRPGATASLIAGRLATSVRLQGIELADQIVTAICGGMVEEYLDPFEEELPGEDPHAIASKQSDAVSKTAESESPKEDSASGNAADSGGSIAAGSASASISDEYRNAGGAVRADERIERKPGSEIVVLDGDGRDLSKAIEDVTPQDVMDSAKNNGSGQQNGDVSSDANQKDVSAAPAEPNNKETQAQGDVSDSRPGEAREQEKKPQENTDDKK